MNTNTATDEKSIDKRTIRAATESMTVVPHGSGSGMFDVYNARGEPYVVDLRDGVCSCPDYVRREPAGGCKHQRRVRIEFGIEDVPAGLRSPHSAPTDVELARKRRGLDREDEPVAPSIEETAAAFVRSAEARRLATDGGRVVAPEPRGESADGGCPHAHPDCEGADADTERPVLCFPCWREWA